MIVHAGIVRLTPAVAAAAGLRARLVLAVGDDPHQVARRIAERREQPGPVRRRALLEHCAGLLGLRQRVADIVDVDPEDGTGIGGRGPVGDPLPDYPGRLEAGLRRINAPTQDPLVEAGGHRDVASPESGDRRLARGRTPHR